jgi:hypothetical protein
VGSAKLKRHPGKSISPLYDDKRFSRYSDSPKLALKANAPARHYRNKRKVPKSREGANAYIYVYIYYPNQPLRSSLDIRRKRTAARMFGLRNIEMCANGFRIQLHRTSRSLPASRSLSIPRARGQLVSGMKSNTVANNTAPQEPRTSCRTRHDA